MPPFTLRRLTGSLGAEVTEIELSKSLPQPTFDALRDALFEHGVLLFPDQHLDDDAQAAFASRFGRPYLHPLGRLYGSSEARVERIVDSVESRPYQDRWHTDVSFDTVPPVIGTLRAIEIPAYGGDTLWASTCDAYDALPEALRERIADLSAVHDSGAGEAFTEKVGLELTRKLQAAYPGTEHPIVGRHPSTGRRYLYVNRQFTRRVVGLPESESDALLETLFGFIESPNRQLRHTWSAGDVGLWDERTTWHFAAADHYPQRREMGRMIVTASAA